MASAAESVFAPIREAAERAGLAEFLRWWKAELVAAVPSAWRARVDGGGPALVSPDAGDWVSWTRSGDSLAESGRARLATLDGAGRRAAFRRLLGEGPGVAPNVWLVLSEDSVLRRRVALPLAAEEALGDAIGFDLDRFTPFTSEQAWFDCRIVARDVNAQRLDVDLAVAPRIAAEGTLAELRELGATVLGVGIAGDLASGAAPLNLLPSDRRERPAPSRAALAARVLAACTAVLFLASLAYPLWLKRERVITLQPRLDSAKVGADVADRLGREIEKIAAEHNFIVGKKQGAHAAVAILEDLSAILPDTTWVQQLDLRSTSKGREVQIAGETGSSSQLVEVIEKSATLANANFKSPLTKGQTPNTERYLLAAEVKVRPLPEPLPETSLLQAAPVSTGEPAPAAPAAGPPAAPATPAPPAAAPGSPAGPKAAATPAPSTEPGSVPPKSPPTAGGAPAVPSQAPAAPFIPPGPMPTPPPMPGRIAAPPAPAPATVPPATAPAPAAPGGR